MFLPQTRHDGSQGKTLAEKYHTKNFAMTAVMAKWLRENHFAMTAVMAKVFNEDNDFATTPAMAKSFAPLTPNGRGGQNGH